jgi:hypothetical protein
LEGRFLLYFCDIFIDAEANKEDDTGLFQGLGTGDEVPEYLQYDGTIYNVKLPEHTVVELVQEIWASKMSHEGLAPIVAIAAPVAAPGGSTNDAQLESPNGNGATSPDAGLSPTSKQSRVGTAGGGAGSGAGIGGIGGSSTRVTTAATAAGSSRVSSAKDKGSGLTVPVSPSSRPGSSALPSPKESGKGGLGAGAGAFSASARFPFMEEDPDPLCGFMEDCNSWSEDHVPYTATLPALPRTCSLSQFFACFLKVCFLICLIYLGLATFFFLCLI